MTVKWISASPYSRIEPLAEVMGIRRDGLPGVLNQKFVASYYGFAVVLCKRIRRMTRTPSNDTALVVETAQADIEAGVVGR